MFQLFEMYAGYLKHLAMMKSAIDYLWKIGGLRNVHRRTIADMLVSIDAIQKDVLRLHNCVQKVSSNVTQWHNSLNLKSRVGLLFASYHQLSCPNLQTTPLQI